MTSRKNQQAARQYMREHDVPYMEALRRATSPPVQAPIPGRPLSQPLILGYTPPQEQGEPAGLSFLDRLRRRPQEPTPAPGPTPYVMDRQDSSRPRLVTVYGPPGTGKTMFLRALLEQFRGHAAYVVHDGHLLDGVTPDGAGVEPWEGLVEVNLRPWQSRAALPDALPAPPRPSLDDLPFGAVVIFDLRDGGAEDAAWPSVYDMEAASVVRQWRQFEHAVAHVARSRGLTVATSVLTRDTPTSPLHSLGAPLGADSIGVRLSPRGASAAPGTPWVYEAFEPNRANDPTPFLLTEREASRLSIPRVKTEKEKQEDERKHMKAMLAFERSRAHRR